MFNYIRFDNLVLHNLRSRLILLMAIGLLITGGLALFFISQAIENNFAAYVAEQEKDRLKRVEILEALLPDMLSAYYEANPSRASLKEITQELEWLIPGEFIVTSPDGRQLLANTTNTGCETLLPVVNQGQATALVCFKSDSRSLELVEETPFRNSVQQSLVVALLIAGTLALFITTGFARHLLQPLDALTGAVRSIDRGQAPTLHASSTITEIRELTNAFNAMAERLEKTETLRRNMVTDVAHELRTPLTNICGYLEAVDDGILELTPELVQSLIEEAQLLAHLVDDLQDLSLAEAGQVPILQEPLQIDKLIATALQMLQLPADKKSVELAIESTDNVPPISADGTRVGQVLRNLIQNAVTHTPNGGRVLVSTAIGSNQGEPELEVRVNNTGDPIDSEHLPFVFERFYRADPARARSTGGYGLGLAIVKQLIEAHGGRVGVESEATSGTSFYFTLPIGA